MKRLLSIEVFVNPAPVCVLVRQRVRFGFAENPTVEGSDGATQMRTTCLD
jgi:hypothetical protein